MGRGGCLPSIPARCGPSGLEPLGQRKDAFSCPYLLRTRESTAVHLVCSRSPPQSGAPQAARRCSCSAHLVVSRLIKAEQHLARRHLLSGASCRVRILTRGRVLGGAAGLPGGDVGRVGGEGQGHHGRVVLREEVLPIAQVCCVHTKDTRGVQRVYSGRSLVAPAP